MADLNIAQSGKTYTITVVSDPSTLESVSFAKTGDASIGNTPSKSDMRVVVSSNNTYSAKTGNFTITAKTASTTGYDGQATKSQSWSYSQAGLTDYVTTVTITASAKSGNVPQAGGTASTYINYSASATWASGKVDNVTSQCTFTPSTIEANNEYSSKTVSVAVNCTYETVSASTKTVNLTQLGLTDYITSVTLTASANGTSVPQAGGTPKNYITYSAKANWASGKTPTDCSSDCGFSPPSIDANTTYASRSVSVTVSCTYQSVSATSKTVSLTQLGKTDYVIRIDVSASAYGTIPQSGGNPASYVSASATAVWDSGKTEDKSSSITFNPPTVEANNTYAGRMVSITASCTYGGKTGSASTNVPQFGLVDYVTGVTVSLSAKSSSNIPQAGGTTTSYINYSATATKASGGTEDATSSCTISPSSIDANNTYSTKSVTITVSCTYGGKSDSKSITKTQDCLPDYVTSITVNVTKKSGVTTIPTAGGTSSGYIDYSAYANWASGKAATNVTSSCKINPDTIPANTATTTVSRTITVSCTYGGKSGSNSVAITQDAAAPSIIEGTIYINIDFNNVQVDEIYYSTPPMYGEVTGNFPMEHTDGLLVNPLTTGASFYSPEPSGSCVITVGNGGQFIEDNIEIKINVRGPVGSKFNVNAAVINTPFGEVTLEDDTYYIRNAEIVWDGDETFTLNTDGQSTTFMFTAYNINYEVENH